MQMHCGSLLLFPTRNRQLLYTVQVPCGAPSDGPACRAWQGLCTRSTSSGLRAARLHSCGLRRVRNGKKVKFKRREEILFLNRDAYRFGLSCYTGWLSPFTNTRFHLPTGKRLFIITCTKIKRCHAPIASLPAVIYAPGQLRRACHLISNVIRGPREKRWLVTDDAIVLKKCLVMWPDEKGCTAGPVLARIDLSCYLFCVYLFYVFPLSPSIERFGMLKFTPHCPAHAKGLPPCN